MSPHRRLSVYSRRHPTQVQDIFLGLAFLLHPPDPSTPAARDPHMRVLEYTTVLNDGTGVLESETFHMDFRLADGDDPERSAPEVRKLMGELTHLVGKLQEEKGMNVSGATRKQTNGAVRRFGCVGRGGWWVVRGVLSAVR